MTQTSLSPKEFIQECFPPRLAAMCTEDAQEICRKNNLDFVQLIQPFCRPNTELISSDLTNHRFYMKNFFLYVTAIEQSIPPSPNVTRNVLHDKVSRAVDDFDWRCSPQMEVPLKDRILRIPSSTPWFDLFREEYIRSFPFNDHEYIRDYLGCVFVASTSVPDPVARIKVLMEQQVQYQANQKYPRWFGPNIFKYFVILDDLSSGDIADRKIRGESAVHYFSSTYGESNCTLLKINSATSEKQILGSAVNPWSFLNSGRQQASINQPINGLDDAYSKSADISKPEHPLADTVDYQLLAKSPTSDQEQIVGALLSEEDSERLRSMIIALITKALIPYAEKLIRSLNELIISKKGIHRTLVNATKKIFGPSGPPKNSQRVSSGTNLSQVVYVGEAVELQNRKVADLSFTFQMYDQSFQFYDSARRDYRNDQAWYYYATASEMCGLSIFLSPSAGFSVTNAKSFPLHFMEDAIKSYSDGGKVTHQSVRATFFATEICKALHLFSEAATFFKGRYLDDFDLLHGIFLEQAAFCFLRLPRPSPGRFAQHLIYAGHRYFKAVQRKLGIITYSLALRVMEGKGWNVAEDHIRLNIVRHSMILKLFDQALANLPALLTSRQAASQQSLILRDFILCNRMVHGDELQELTVPAMVSQKLRTVIGRIEDVDSQTVEIIDDEWVAMEEKLISARKHSHPVFRHQQVIFSDQTDNRHHPVTSIQEVVTLNIPIKNLLDIPLLLSEVRLSYSFLAREIVTSEPSVKLYIPSSSLLINPLEESHFICSVESDQPGSLSISGIQYNLRSPSNQLPEDGNGNLSINGQQNFDILGWRLNGTKAEKSGVLHAPDHRLDITVITASGKLVAKWESFPRSVLAGQVVRLGLIIENQGQRSVDHLALLSSHPDMFTFFNCQKDGDIVNLQLPDGKIGPGEKVSLSAVFIAPLCPAPYVFKSLLYYESVPIAEDKDRKHKYRLWRLQHALEVLPCITMKGSIQPVGGSLRDAVITLQMEHINEVQLKCIPFKVVEVLSLNPVWKLRKLTGDFLNDGSICAGEEMHVVIAATKTENKDDALSSFTVCSSLDILDQNFVRAARTLTSVFLGNDADELVLRVLWKISLMADGKATNVYGVRAIKFTTPVQGEFVDDICRVLNRKKLDPFLIPDTDNQLTTVDSVNERIVGNVVDWLIEFPATKIESTFNTGGIRRVALKLHLLCTALMSLDKAVQVTVEFRTAVKCFPVRTKKLNLELISGQTVSIPFQYCFIAPGTYNLAEFVTVRALCVHISELKVPKQQKPSCGQMLFSL